MEPVPLLECAGRRRSPATLSSFHQGRTPRNKGRRYPPDPPSVEEIIAVMRACGNRPEGVRLRAMIVVLWRAGSADQRSARADRTRSGPPPRCRAGPAREGRQAPRGRHGPLGLGAARPMARAPRQPPRRRAVLRDARPDPRPTLRTGRDPRRAAPRRRGGRGPPTIRAASLGRPGRYADGGREVAAEEGSCVAEVGIFRGPRGTSGACRGVDSGRVWRRGVWLGRSPAACGSCRRVGRCWSSRVARGRARGR